MPLLESDLLDAAENWRRYAATPAKGKAERINRKVYIMSPLRAVHNGNPPLLHAQWIAHYAIHDSTLIGSDNATIHLNTDNDPQFGLCLLRVNGQARFDDEGYIIRASEMIVEIAGSSASYDLCENRDVYDAVGVSDCLVFETIEGRMACWRLKNGQFAEIQPENGIYKSVLFLGLWLYADAVSSASSLKLTQILQQGIESV
jgi:hypothetical protein